MWVLGAAAVAFGALAYSYLTLPDVRSLATTNPTTTAFMEIRAAEARQAGKPPRNVHRWVAYSRISPSLKRAVLTAEDAAFWDHDGVDYDELQKSIEAGFVRGASTITQQLAKNLYLSPSRSPVRKFLELIIARRLEAELSKARILEIYLNVIEWGDGVYGVEAAAHTYFGTSAASLGPADSALLAGAIINARLLSPAHPPLRLLRRQQLILRRMGSVSPPIDDAQARPKSQNGGALDDADAPAETQERADESPRSADESPRSADESPRSADESKDEKSAPPELDRPESPSL